MLGVRDGALAAGKPDKASGEDEGEKNHRRCEAEADPLDEVGVGSREDRFLRGGIEMLDRGEYREASLNLYSTTERFILSAILRINGGVQHGFDNILR